MTLTDNENIPKHWEVKNLGEVCTYSKGKKPKVLSTEIGDTINIPYINIKAFEKGIFHEYTDGEKCNLCEDGDLLMVWDGARAGFTGKAKRGAVGSTLMKIEPKDGVLKNYLFYFLLSLYKKLNTNPRGVGIPHVEPSLLWNSELIIPPLPEQQSIVSKIEALFSELDNSVAQLKLAQQQLKTYRQSVLKAAFEGKLTEEWRNENSVPSRGLEHSSVKVRNLMGQQIKKTKETVIPLGFLPGALVAEAEVEYQTKSKLPEGWRWVKLGDVVYNVEYGSAAKSKESGKIPVLRMGNIQNGVFDWTDLVYTDDDVEIKKYFLFKNDVLFNRTNSAELVGKTAIYKGEQPAIFAGYLIRINRKTDLIDANYLTYYLNTTKAKNYGNSVRSFGVNQSNINGTKLKTYPIPLAPLIEQEKVVFEIERLLSVADNLEQTITQSLQQAEALRQSILKQAFEGSLI